MTKNTSDLFSLLMSIIFWYHKAHIKHPSQHGLHLLFVFFFECYNSLTIPETLKHLRLGLGHGSRPGSTIVHFAMHNKNLPEKKRSTNSPEWLWMTNAWLLTWVCFIPSDHLGISWGPNVVLAARRTRRFRSALLRPNVAPEASRGKKKGIKQFRGGSGLGTGRLCASESRQKNGWH